MIWIKNAPRYGVDDNEDVCRFIDQYITCSIPKDEGKLKDLVLLLQQHKHSSYCKRNNVCRFSFPHPPSPETLIAEPAEDSSDAIEVLKKVRKVLKDASKDVLTLTEVLDKAEVSSDQYKYALAVSTKGSIVVLKREPTECNVNSYSVPVMLA